MATPPLPTSLQAYQFAGLAPSPKLIVLGAVHGNETCGTRAIHRLLQALQTGELHIERGLLTLVPVTNPLAYQLKRRHGDRNLNRYLWVALPPADFEDRIANVLCPWLRAHDVLLDLHSFHMPGQPFAMPGPQDNAGDLEPFAQAMAEAQLAVHLGPPRLVEGWMETYARGVQRRRESGQVREPGLLDTRYGIGTTEYMRSVGRYGITLECGRHEDPQAVEVAHRAILQTLALLGLATLPLEPAAAFFEILRLVDVTDRDHEGDCFEQPWKSFDSVMAGQIIGHRHNGEAVLAPSDGFVLFPNPNALMDNEWFYFAQRSDRPVPLARAGTKGETSRMGTHPHIEEVGPQNGL